MLVVSSSAPVLFNAQDVFIDSPSPGDSVGATVQVCGTALNGVNNVTVTFCATGQTCPPFQASTTAQVTGGVWCASLAIPNPPYSGTITAHNGTGNGGASVNVVAEQVAGVAAMRAVTEVAPTAAGVSRHVVFKMRYPEWTGAGNQTDLVVPWVVLAGNPPTRHEYPITPTPSGPVQEVWHQYLGPGLYLVKFIFIDGTRQVVTRTVGKIVN